MRHREEAPEGIRPRFVVGQVTGYDITQARGGGGRQKPRRTYYVMDMADRARVVWTVEAGRSPQRWDDAHKRAATIADNLNANLDPEDGLDQTTR